MRVGTGRLIKTLGLLLMIGTTCARGLAPETACSLRCQALSGGGCCPMPADHAPESPCCGELSHAPSAVPVPEADTSTRADIPPVLVAVTEPCAAPLAIAAAPVRSAGLAVGRVPPLVCLRI